MSGSGIIESWKRQAKKLRTDTHALYLAFRDPRVPWYTRAVTTVVIAYAFSPIDLIPDFIPVLGYLDDLLLVPIGIGIALRMIPDEVMQESREKARRASMDGIPTNWKAAIVVVGIWIVLAAAFTAVLIRFLKSS